MGDSNVETGGRYRAPAAGGLYDKKLSKQRELMKLAKASNVEFLDNWYQAPIRRRPPGAVHAWKKKVIVEAISSRERPPAERPEMPSAKADAGQVNWGTLATKTATAPAATRPPTAPGPRFVSKMVSALEDGERGFVDARLVRVVDATGRGYLVDIHTVAEPRDARSTLVTKQAGRLVISDDLKDLVQWRARDAAKGAVPVTLEGQCTFLPIVADLAEGERGYVRSEMVGFADKSSPYLLRHAPLSKEPFEGSVEVDRKKGEWRVKGRFEGVTFTNYEPQVATGQVLFAKLRFGSKVRTL